jgi:hypothetical protein
LIFSKAILIHYINSALIDSVNDVNFILNGNKVNGIHKQSWWTNELFHLKKKVKESQMISQANALFNHLKKLFHSNYEDIDDVNHRQTINQRVNLYYNDC